MRIDEYLRIYEAKHDDELLLLAGNSAELTDEARTALQSELARRGIKAEPLVIPDIAGERNVSSTRRVMKLNGPKTLAEFLKSVSSLYWNHFWLFVAFTVPVIAISYYLRVLAQGERNRLLTEFWSQGGESSRSVLILKISLINHASYFVSWLCFCVCYAGIASAVGQINTGHWPSALKCFVEFRRRPGAFFKVSILLYVILMAVGMVAALVFGALFSLLPTRIMLSPVGLMIMYGYVILVAVVVSRLALSIPAVTLGDYTVRQSFFLSHELTRGKWSMLISLMTKSFLGGYIAGMLPFWIATWIWSRLYLHLWFLRIVSIIGVVLVEPIMFIGLSLLYTTTLKEGSEHGEPTSVPT